MALPLDRSDNNGRVRRIIDFARRHLYGTEKPTLLDIGSGLGVFPYCIKQLGWNCTALDPDPKASRHLTENLGIHTLNVDLLKFDTANLSKFNVITLNKVLEHLEDPIEMLTKALSILSKEGFIYVEVPDILSSIDGPQREEYFIEHHHVFSPESLVATAERAGLLMKCLTREREPSGKYSIFGFFTPFQNLIRNT